MRERRDDSVSKGKVNLLSVDLPRDKDYSLGLLPTNSRGVKLNIFHSLPFIFSPGQYSTAFFFFFFLETSIFLNSLTPSFSCTNKNNIII